MSKHYTGRHRAITPPNRAGAALRRTTTGVALATTLSVGLGAGAAWAVPEQGGVVPSVPEQGGVTPEVPEQGGVTTPPPAPAPTPSVTPPGPGLIPGPPSTSEWQPIPEAVTPNYENAYNPTPAAPLHAPRPTAPVKRIAPPPDTLRVGNVMVPTSDIPDIENKDETINSVNAWAAYAEAEIARGLISIGVPEDEASRQAASTVIGVALGGGIGGTVFFTGTTLAMIVPAVVIGGVIGGVVGAAAPPSFGIPTNPFFWSNLGGGVAAGAGVGAAVAVGTGAVVGSAAAITGAVIGGVLAYALGAGDPGVTGERPALPWTPDQEESAPLPSPEANQFEFHLPPEAAQRAGLPPVEYIVNNPGDVEITATLGGQEHVFGWSAEIAQAPIKALGPFAPLAERAINNGTRLHTDQAEKDIPGSDARWPQEEGPAAQTEAPQPAPEAAAR